jgi:hypothetical protein
MKPAKSILLFARSAVAIVALQVAAQADTLYNVLTGQGRGPGGGLEILPVHNVFGPAALNATGQTWNGFSDNNHLSGTLKTSTGTPTAVTFTAGPSGEWGSAGPGPSLFQAYVYHPSTASFTGLNPGSTYDLYVLASSYWGDRGAIAITQTAGTGLTNTFWINRFGNPSLFSQDTNAANSQGNFDFARFDGLTPSAGGALTFTYTGNTGDGGSIAGYQLVEHPGTTPYQIWSGGAGFSADANGDGVANGMAWMVGAPSTIANAPPLLPKPGRETGYLTMTFLRVQDLGPAHLYLEYSNSLASSSWTVVDLAGPLGDIVVTSSPGIEIDEITVKIPTTYAASGHLFARLSATED